MTESQEQAAREAYWSWRSEQEDNLLTNSINAYLAAELARVERERDAAMADANRYRWLRDSPTWMLDYDLRLTIQLRRNELWDEQIDAALATKEQPC